MTFKAPYLTYRDVGKYAEDFLTKYHPALDWNQTVTSSREYNLFHMNSGLMPRTNFPIILK